MDAGRVSGEKGHASCASGFLLLCAWKAIPWLTAPYGSLLTFTPSTTVKKDTDHMMFARTESLTGGTALVFSFARLTLTLLTSYIHPESISFAESL